MTERERLIEALPESQRCEKCGKWHTDNAPYSVTKPVHDFFTSEHCEFVGDDRCDCYDDFNDDGTCPYCGYELHEYFSDQHLSEGEDLDCPSCERPVHIEVYWQQWVRKVRPKGAENREGNGND